MSDQYFFATDHFVERHIGISPAQQSAMLAQLGVDTLDQLIDQTVPPNIRLQQPLDVGAPLSEYAYMQHIRQQMAHNQLWRSYLGQGYYGTIVPAVIQRNILENPGWYTQYTPYQAEIAQGRLEALLNFQTMVCDLTAMPVANASLLDEATAAAEAMQMLFRTHNKSQRAAQHNRILVADTCLPTTIAVLQTRAQPLGIVVEVLPTEQFELATTTDVFACLLQYPAQDGSVHDYAALSAQAHAAGIQVIVAADLLSLCLLTPPGEWGADVVVGSSQRLGVPLGYGGPHAAYFATRDDLVRQMPGRIIGASTDRQGNTAYRMALQTREQHIRRDKATSNICTAQALLAIMAGMYGVYHGAKGLRRIATRVHVLATTLNAALNELGYVQRNTYFFDTLLVDLSQHTDTSGLRVRRVAELAHINFRYFEGQPDLIGISVDETTTLNDLQHIVTVFAEACNRATPALTPAQRHIPEQLHRHSAYLSHTVFNRHHSETQLLRYIKQLEAKDLSLAFGMIPLGSCTMKLNATTQLMPLSFAPFSQLHPFVPHEQATAYHAITNELCQHLAHITGFAACSLQPNSGAQGEYAGLMVIRAYHHAQGQPERRVALIPQSAHGTNPASAIMAGMDVVVVRCDDDGNIALDDLQAKAQQYSQTLSCLMITYPSTHGVFEETVTQICAIIHQHGGQVYMDGANMNAQVGLTNPGVIGADVCHLNLHKTFAIPHGGGGPGMGPICVAVHLAPYLPTHQHLAHQHPQAVTAVSAAPYGSASILLISYAYIKMLGSEGLTQSTRIAILNANYIKSRLEADYPILYVGKQGRVAHELIVDARPFKQSAGIEAEDIAKRLIDYGFHAPTVSFPVAGTLMIEPTESEDLAEIDRFCDAMLAIRHEIREIELAIADPIDNVLKNAPHPLAEITADEWAHVYSRQKAAYPLPSLYQHKFWASVARVNNTQGDRHLICTCPPMADYMVQQ